MSPEAQSDQSASAVATPGSSPLQRAILSLEDAVQGAPENVDLLIKLGEAYIQAGCFQPKSLPIFERVLAERPRSAAFQSALSIAYLIKQIEDLRREPAAEDQTGIQETIDTLTALAGDFPNSPDLMKCLGDLQTMAGHFPQAVESYRSALEAGFAPIQEILSAFQRAEDSPSIGHEALTYFARLYRLVGDDSRCTALLERAVDNGGGAEAQRALLEAYGVERLDAKEMENLSEEALGRVLAVLIDSGQEEKIGALVDRLDRSQASNHEIFLRLAERQLSEGKPWEAYERLRQMSMDSRGKDLLNRAADLLEKSGRYDEASEVLHHINENDYLIQEATQIQERRLLISTELELADLHLKNQRYGKAFDKYVNVLLIGAPNADALITHIDTILERGERVESSKLLALGDFFQARHDPKRAISYWMKLLGLDPKHSEAAQRAEHALDALVLSQPGKVQPRLERGAFCLRVGKIRQAMEDLLIAASDPSLAKQANRLLGRAYIANSDWLLAFERFRSVTLGDEDLETVYDLAQKLEDGGLPAEARQALTLIRGINPGFRDVQEKLAAGEAAGPAPGTVVDPRMRALIGDLAVGRYRYGEKIGSGGMGVVHKVFDVQNNRPVAMKILREGLANNNRALMRFVREAQYADELHHPNIVHIYDFNISKIPGQSFITMEYVDGLSLREILDKRIKAGFKVDPEYLATLMDYMIQLCDALDATHKKGIVHRDIKPDNIMVDSTGVVKITDFGIVHVEEGGPTPTGVMLGTPRYMSPEQVRGTKISTSSDLYSVGVALYEMLASAPPFISGDIAYQQVNVRPVPPREIVPLISPSLNQIIMTCLEKLPERRYQSARSLKVCLVEELKSMGGAERLRPTTVEAGDLKDMDE